MNKRMTEKEIKEQERNKSLTTYLLKAEFSLQQLGHFVRGFKGSDRVNNPDSVVRSAKYLRDKSDVILQELRSLVDESRRKHDSSAMLSQYLVYFLHPETKVKRCHAEILVKNKNHAFDLAGDMVEGSDFHNAGIHLEFNGRGRYSYWEIASIHDGLSTDDERLKKTYLAGILGDLEAKSSNGGRS